MTQNNRGRIIFLDHCLKTANGLLLGRAGTNFQAVNVAIMYNYLKNLTLFSLFIFLPGLMEWEQLHHLDKMLNT